MTTDEKIYFYMIDKETLQPNLENCMNNFMQCSQMMFGAKVRNGITYKTNQPGFQIYKRKYYHNFKVQITNQNYEGALGANLGSMNAYIMCEKKNIGVYDQHDFQVLQQWSIPTKSSGDDIEILYMAVSPDEQKIGICVGRQLIKDQQEITEIVIYQKNSQGKFEIEKLRDFEFKDACIQF